MSGRLRNLVLFLRRLTGAADQAGATDPQLLERFVRERDEAAFALLLERHGPMVRGVCRRALSDPNAADDAFQATFLVLARRAAAVSWHESVGGWLHEVAWRIARKARTAANRDAELVRRLARQEDAAVDTTDPGSDADRRELRAVLDEELSHLPEKYRLPLVLCYLEGQTNEEAAQLLGWTKGTVSGRLARARDLLRPRLARRGLALSAAALAALAETTASAAVPPALFRATLKAAVLYATDPATAAGVISAQVLAFADGGLQTMFRTRLTIAACLLLLGLFGTGAAVITLYALAAEPQQARQTTAPKPPDNPRGEKAVRKTDPERFQGTWHLVSAEVSGKPLSEKEREGMPEKVVVDGDQFIEYRGDFGVESIMKLDPTKEPKTVDWITRTDVIEDGVKRVIEEVTGRGVYELEGDTFTIAQAEDGTLPTTLKPGPDSKILVQIYKRGEPPAKPDTQKQPEFVEAEITLHLGRDGLTNEPEKELKKVVKDKATLARFVACFPEMGRGKTSNIFGGWSPRMSFKFKGSKGETVAVSSIWTNWSEGNGDWLVKANLMKYAGELFDVPRLTDQGNLTEDWLLVSVEVGGKALDPKNWKVGVTLKNFSVHSGDRTDFEADYYELGPEKTPKEIDLYLDSQTRDKKRYQGIYALDGDTLKICLDKGDKNRPTEFKTVPGNADQMLLVLKLAPR